MRSRLWYLKTPRGQDAYRSPSVLLSSGCTFATALRNALHHTVPLGRIRALKLLVGEVAPVIDLNNKWQHFQLFSIQLHNS